MYKIGFHTSGSGGNPSGLGDYLYAVAQNPTGVQVVVCADGDVGFSDAKNQRVLLYRKTLIPDGRGGHMPAIPNMENAPDKEARAYWNRLMPVLPKFDKSRVWLQTINEPPHNVRDSDWLGAFSTEQAKLANAAGYKYMAFGFSTGTPDDGAWQTTGMLQYLRYCEKNKGYAGICLHEYSLDVNDIKRQEGNLIGRFKKLFEVCDKHKVMRPDVIIGEAGWTRDNVPSGDKFIKDAKWLADVYAPYNDVLGVALWWLGPKFGEIADRLQNNIAPLATIATSYRFKGELSMPPNRIGEPRVQYKRTVWLWRESDMSQVQLDKLTRWASENQVTLSQSFDDAGIGNLTNKSVVCWNIPEGEHADIIRWFKKHYTGTRVSFQHTDKANLLSAKDITLPTNGAFKLRPVSEISTIVVHHTVGETDMEKIALKYINDYGWAGIAYHYVIDGTGVVYKTNTLDAIAHPTDFHGYHSIDIALIGDFSDKRPTPAQLDATERLVNTIESLYTISSVLGHKDMPQSNTSCPGTTDWVIELGHKQKSDMGDAREPYRREVHVYPPHYNKEQRLKFYQKTVNSGKTASPSYDDAGIGYGLNEKRVVLYGVNDRMTAFIDWYKEHYPDTTLMFEYTPPPPPPTPAPNPLPSTTPYANFGIHASADSHNMRGDLARIKRMKPDVIKVLSSHNPFSVKEIASATNARLWIVRTYLNFGTSTVTPEQFVEWTKNDVLRTLSHLSGQNVVIELHNEPNLTDEGLGSSWKNGREFGDWLIQSLHLYKKILPHAKFITPGLSPGVAIPNRRIAHEEFWTGMKHAIPEFDGVGVHAYWSNPNYPIETAINTVRWFARESGKPVYITEYSNNNIYTSQGEKAKQYLHFAVELSKLSQYKGSAAFVLSASNQSWGWEKGGSGEIFTDVMADVIANR